MEGPGLASGLEWGLADTLNSPPPFSLCSPHTLSLILAEMCLVWSSTKEWSGELYILFGDHLIWGNKKTGMPDFVSQLAGQWLNKAYLSVLSELPSFTWQIEGRSQWKPESVCPSPGPTMCCPWWRQGGRNKGKSREGRKEVQWREGEREVGKRRKERRRREGEKRKERRS